MQQHNQRATSIQCRKAISFSKYTWMDFHR